MPELIACRLRLLVLRGCVRIGRGVETKLWHSTLISALMFLTYEKIHLAVERVITGYEAKKGVEKQA